MQPNNEKDACKKALRLLEHMDRTEKGLRDKLLQSGFSQEAADKAVAYVKDYGYVDDLRYAMNFILYRIHGKSREKIFQDLIKKGVSREIIENAWEEACTLEEPDEQALLRAEIEKKYEPGAELDEKEFRRLYGYLARRGFRPGDISSVLEEMEINRIYH